MKFLIIILTFINALRADVSTAEETLIDKIKIHAHNNGGSIDTTNLSKTFSEGVFTVDELKIWVARREFDKKEFKKNRRVNAPDLIEGLKQISKKDPRWAVQFYYTKIKEVKMLSKKESPKIINESWLPNKQDIYIDQFLSAIIEGWSSEDKKSLNDWKTKMNSLYHLFPEK